MSTLKVICIKADNYDWLHDPEIQKYYGHSPEEILDLLIERARRDWLDLQPPVNEVPGR